MRFLKTLFWILLGGLIGAFIFYNAGERAELRLWGGLLLDTSLPALMSVCFLLGLVPVWLWYRAVAWRLRSRLATAERTIADMRQVAAAAAAAPVALPAPIAGDAPDTGIDPA